MTSQTPLSEQKFYHASALWSKGHGTQYIAKRLQVTECRVYNSIQPIKAEARKLLRTLERSVI